MDRAVLLSVAMLSALVGGLTGALATRWLTPSEKGAPARELSAEPPEDATRRMQARLDALERSVQALELRPSIVERPPVAPSVPGSSAPEPKKSTALVDDPVFEAAVLDVISRAESGRASEREARREERKRERIDQWAARLNRELSLEPGQLGAVLKIREELAKALEERSPGKAGAGLTRKERRAQVEALQNEAENKLRAQLSPRQVAAYDRLDPELKLGRAAR